MFTTSTCLWVPSFFNDFLNSTTSKQIGKRRIHWYLDRRQRSKPGGTQLLVAPRGNTWLTRCSCLLVDQLPCMFLQGSSSMAPSFDDDTTEKKEVGENQGSRATAGGRMKSQWAMHKHPGLRVAKHSSHPKTPKFSDEAQGAGVGLPACWRSRCSGQWTVPQANMGRLKHSGECRKWWKISILCPAWVNSCGPTGKKCICD